MKNDVKSRINWQLLPLGLLRECATDGCGNPAAYEFEAGGVASTYCVHCAAGIERVLGCERLADATQTESGG